MSDRAAFMEKIIREPDEDTHRLVFADWLEEHGEEPFALWIRSRVANPATTARLGPHDAICAFGGIVARGIRAFAGKGVYPDGYLTYRRGFVEEVDCTAASWLAHADALCWHPGQTVECDECVDGQYSVGFQLPIPCPACDGKGRVPRPCPPTAHPITRVALTTWPDRNEVEHAASPARRMTTTRQYHQYRVRGRQEWFDEPACEAAGGGSILLGLFAMTWPGITLEGPPVEPVAVEMPAFRGLLDAAAIAADLGMEINTRFFRSITGIHMPPT